MPGRHISDLVGEYSVSIDRTETIHGFVALHSVLNIRPLRLLYSFRVVSFIGGDKISTDDCDHLYTALNIYNDKCSGLEQLV